MTKRQRQNMKEWAKGEQGDAHEMKTACLSACAEFLGVLNFMRYLHTIIDLVNGLRRNGYSVRSRMSRVKKGTTVGGLRKQMHKLENGIYLIRVDSHALLMTHDGETIVDTAPRKRDRRRITHLYLVRRISSDAGDRKNFCKLTATGRLYDARRAV